MRKNKIISVGSFNSVNVEIISKSIATLFKNKIKFLLVGNQNKIRKYFKNYNLENKINIIDNISLCKPKKINVYDSNKLKGKYNNKILNDISISYDLAVKSKSDLVTMPINKYEIKKRNNFNGITEFLGKLNKTKTYMIMKGDLFSVIPLTTHIPLKDVSKNFIKQLKDIETLFKYLIQYNTKFKNIIFLGINPHAGEDDTLGNEEKLLKSKIKNLKTKFKNFKFKGPISADSAFKKIVKNCLYISAYHDQALIPFKILNKNQINFTIGLKVRRFSPAHGTAKDIKNKNKAQIKSFLECMKI